MFFYLPMVHLYICIKIKRLLKPGKITIEENGVVFFCAEYGGNKDFLKKSKVLDAIYLKHEIVGTRYFNSYN